MTAGTLTTTGSLCNTMLYFNVGDHESSSSCPNLNASWNHATYGPAWSCGNKDGCPLDDPCGSSLGPCNDVPADDVDNSVVESGGRGFGSGASLNTGVPESGENNLRVYVR